ncbi:MAG: hypothetical protein VX610_05110 [SAR324 cluster bacterium]|nr:hypothetical protein [SAR324 cluster bacterium]
MNIKENIYRSISTMNSNELILLYDQILVLESLKKEAPRKKPNFSIEDLHELTATSEGNWSDDVIEAREDRV